MSEDNKETEDKTLKTTKKQLSEEGETTAAGTVKSASADAKKSDGDASSTPNDDDDATPTLRQIIKEQAIEGEVRGSRNFTLRKILGGDILTTAAVRRQIWLLVIITVFVFFYISNRYSCQKKMIEMDQLQKELTDAKYKALSSSSKLTEMSRESNVLETLKNNKDSALKTPMQPPYFIEIPSK